MSALRCKTCGKTGRWTRCCANIWQCDCGHEQVVYTRQQVGYTPKPLTFREKLLVVICAIAIGGLFLLKGT